MSVSVSGLSLSDSERRRVEEIDRLTASGADGVPRLIDMLGERSWTVRRAVVAGLGTLGAPAIDALCRFLETRRENEAALAAAVDALVASTGPADAAVAALAKGAEPALAADVAQVLGRRGNTSELPTLIALAGHPSDNVAVASLEALGRIGGRAAIESLIAAARSDNFFRTFPTIDVLGRTGDPRAVACLADLLEKPRYRVEAARALGRSGEQGAAAPLARLLVSTVDADVRMAAVALAELRQRHGDRYGSPDAAREGSRESSQERSAAPIDELIRRAAGSDAGIDAALATRRLIGVLAGAAPDEQQAIALVLGVLGVLGDPSAAPTLIDLLGARDEAPEVARAAAEALHRMGTAAEGAVIVALRSGDSRRRSALLPLLSRGGAVDEIVGCLADADPAVRAAACDALGRLGNAAVTPSLIALLDDRNPRVAQAATGALQALGGTETLRLATLAAASPSAAVRRSALRILGYLGYDAALGVLLGARADADQRVRDAAIYGLAFIDGAAAREALLAALRDRSSEKMRAAAARALGERAGEPEAVTALIAAVDDPDPWVRYYACQSLGKLGAGVADADAAAARATAAIESRLDDPAGQVRLGAIEALSHFASDDARRALERAARSEDADTRRAALIGLGLGARPAALPILLEATASADAATRLVAFSAIGSLGAAATAHASVGSSGEAGAGAHGGAESAAILRALVAGAADPDDTVRRGAVAVLGARVDASAALLGILRRAPEDQAVQAALSIPSPERIAALQAALRAADDEQAPYLAGALARMRERAATAALIDALGAGSAAAKKAAAPALAALAGDDAQRALRNAATRDPDAEVRRVCSLLVAH